MLRNWSFYFYLLCSLISPSALAAGVEAIQLQHVPIDASLGCDRIFFKSTQYFKGTIYVLPYVMLDIDAYGEPIFDMKELHPSKDGKTHALNFQLYFPYDEADIKSRVNSDNVGATQTCNFTAVKNFLNKGVVDPEQQIKTISPMPLTFIEVSIPDMIASVSRAGNGGTDSNDVIDYLGKPRAFRLSMTAPEYENILSAIQSNVGLQAKVRFYFKARQNDGAVRININRQQIAMNFKLNAKGKYIAQAELDAALRLAMTKSGITIETDAGTNKSELLEKVTAQLIDKVISQLDLSSNGGSDKAQPNNTPIKCDAPEGQACVAIVADYLSQKLDQSITFTNNSAPEIATAESTVDLNIMRIEDPKIHVIKVISGEADPVLSEPIYKGDVVKINPGFLSTITREYRKIESYLTLDELSKPTISTHFSDYLSSGFFKVTDQTRNNQTIAVGKDWGVLGLMNDYLWKKITLRPQVVNNPRIKLSVAKFKELPIRLSFSSIGNDRIFTSLDKLKENSNQWDADMDENGTITIRAKEDLGLMKFRESFKIKKDYDKENPEKGLAVDEFVREAQDIETVIMETRGWTGTTQSKPVVIRRNERAVRVLKVAYLYVSKTKANEASPTNTESGIMNQNSDDDEKAGRFFSPPMIPPKKPLDPIPPLQLETPLLP